MPNDAKVIVYRDILLPKSETFVKEQADNLVRFKPVFAGYKYINYGIQLDSNNVICNQKTDTARTTIKEALIKTSGLNWKLIKEIQQVQPRLIHAQFGPDGSLVLPIAKRLNLPLLVSFHGYDATMDDQSLLKGSFNARYYVRNKEKLMKNATNFIAVSNFIKSKLVDRGFPQDKIMTHYIGIDTEKFAKSSTTKKENTVLFVGRLVPNKGCNYLLQAMKKVQNNISNAELIIIGDGPEKEKLMKTAKELNISCKFLGHQPQEEVINWLNKAKVFCVPSTEVESGASEGLGMVFLEAQAMGVPVASFKTGGIPEAVLDKQTGFLYEQRNWSKLAEGITALLENEHLYNQFSTNAVVHVNKRFNIIKQTNELETIYQDISSNK
ncbi:glycosyltransferase [Bacillus marinisedimentorum]|uniref:glycosyltransferase n=1 Tax=Bacillus marinisedimentorum TaxID=1821260 RepID=UPI0007E27720|nr:glycosyltransferase [Bacillus marinisedimentorum]